MADPSSLLVTDGAVLSQAEVDQYILSGLAEVDACELGFTRKYDLIPSIVCSVCLLLGLIYCFFGYRCFKMVMFLSGFMFGSALVCLLYLKEPVLDTQLTMETKAGILLGVSVLCALVTMLVQTVGLIITGLELGFLLTLANLLVVRQFYSLTPLWVPLGAILATSTFCATLTLQWQKLFTVLATAAVGAAVVMACVDYFVETSLLAGHAYDILSQVPPRPLCWYSWVITGVFPLFSLMGVMVQWMLTAKGLSHTEVPASGRQRQVQLMRIRQRDAQRRPQLGTYRHRKPPILKRYAGDVLAPSYIQSLRDRQMGTGSSSSSIISNSTVNHTTIDLDFETGFMVPLNASSLVYRV
uniref:transmembrane protein 198-like n=1 Tax=Oncorhynchus gorbuscha TaxID=8017 RepID=UPI001EAEF4A3|nr:transmembrane protein 198-like [Oncorhynchus gorbuscha]XP_046193429.1 transmembrane protein 198-like [Oncorhynchus gorbuscha]